MSIVPRIICVGSVFFLLGAGIFYLCVRDHDAVTNDIFCIYVVYILLMCLACATVHVNVCDRVRSVSSVRVLPGPNTQGEYVLMIAEVERAPSVIGVGDENPKWVVVVENPQ